MIFDHDWWCGGQFERQTEFAKRGCLALKFPDAGDDLHELDPQSEAGKVLAELECRTVVYLRDGFSYELKRLVDLGSTAYLSFECVPSDEAYKVGAFVLSVPFEEIARVETFAVHPREKPDEQPSIKGFAGAPVPTAGRGEERTLRMGTHDQPADSE